MGGDDTATVQAFIEQTQITFPAGIELTTSYFTLYNAVKSISPYPLNVIIDRDGNLAYMVGDYDPEGMRAMIESLLP